MGYDYRLHEVGKQAQHSCSLLPDFGYNVIGCFTFLPPSFAHNDGAKTDIPFKVLFYFLGGGILP